MISTSRYGWICLQCTASVTFVGNHSVLHSRNFGCLEIC